MEKSIVIILDSGHIEYVDADQEYFDIDLDVVEDGCCPICGDDIVQTTEVVGSFSVNIHKQQHIVVDGVKYTSDDLVPTGEIFERSITKTHSICHRCEIDWDNTSSFDEIVQKSRAYMRTKNEPARPD